MKTIRKTNVKQSEIKNNLGILEKITLVNNIIEFATIEIENEKTYNCNYLEIAKVYYIATNYINEKYIKKCPTTIVESVNDKNEVVEIETLDIFETYNKIMRDNVILNGEEKQSIALIEYLNSLQDIKQLCSMVDNRYKELKEMEDKNNNFEIYIKKTIEEVKTKFINTMNKIDLKELKEQQKELPKILSSLNGNQKEVLSKLVELDKINKDKKILKAQK